MESQNAEIMAIPMQVSPAEFDLILVMKPINLERLQQYDPASLPLESVNGLFPGLKLRCITLAFATPEECQQIMDHRRLGHKIGAILELLSRGWEYRPECGDSDEPPTFIWPPGRG
jgi:hypothetical protein